MQIQIQIKGIDGGDAWKGALAAVERVSEGYNRSGVRVGILEGATRSDNGKLIAAYAMANEFGVPGKIPPRPFMRNTMNAKKSDWCKFAAATLKGAAGDRHAIHNAWELLGRAAATDIQQTIKDGVPPENAESTKKRKMKQILGGEGGTYSPGTLIDTGEMIKAISHEVVEA